MEGKVLFENVTLSTVALPPTISRAVPGILTNEEEETVACASLNRTAEFAHLHISSAAEEDGVFDVPLNEHLSISTASVVMIQFQIELPTSAAICEVEQLDKRRDEDEERRTGVGER